MASSKTYRNIILSLLLQSQKPEGDIALLEPSSLDWDQQSSCGHTQLQAVLALRRLKGLMHLCTRGAASLLESPTSLAVPSGRRDLN